MKQSTEKNLTGWESQLAEGRPVGYLTIIPRAWMGYESTAHDTRGIIIVLAKSN